VKPVVLPQLRFRRMWFSLGLLLALIIMVVCLMPGRSLPSLKLSDKIEHVMAFATLAFWFGSIVVRRDLIGVAIALLLFGGLIEVAQGAMRLGRSADWEDVLADGIGIAAGLVVALTPLGRWAGWIENGLLRKVA